MVVDILESLLWHVTRSYLHDSFAGADGCRRQLSVSHCSDVVAVTMFLLQPDTWSNSKDDISAVCLQDRREPRRPGPRDYRAKAGPGQKHFTFPVKFSGDLFLVIYKTKNISNSITCFVDVTGLTGAGSSHRPWPLGSVPTWPPL